MSTVNPFAALIAQVAYRRLVANYVLLAGFVLFFIDYTQTFSTEVRLIWPKSWSLMKILFLTSRYLPWVYGPYLMWVALVPEMDYHRCGPNMVASSLVMITAMVIAEAIMYIRVWALGGSTKKLGAALLVQFLGIHVAIYTVLGIFLRSVEYRPSPLPKIVACMPADTNTTKLTTVYGIIVASETMIMIISIILGFSRYKASNNRLLAVFHRDGIFYFVTLAGITTANIIFDSVAPLELKFMLAAPQGCLHSILSCRLILHLHEFAEKELSTDESGEKKSSLQFAVSAATGLTAGIGSTGQAPVDTEKGKEEC